MLFSLACGKSVSQGLPANTSSYLPIGLRITLVKHYQVAFCKGANCQAKCQRLSSILRSHTRHLRSLRTSIYKRSLE